MGVVEAGMARVVEFGCGDGRVSRALMDLGVNVHAVEKDPGMRAQAVERGVTVEPDASGTADVVFALQVVEHFADPIRGLTAMAEVGERIYIEVPTVERPYVSLSHFLQRPHVVNFSQHTLGVALKRAGWTNVHTAIEGQVLCALGTKGSGPQPYEPHGGPSAEEVVETLHAWERKRTATERATAITQRFEAGEWSEMTEADRSFILNEWARWRTMAVDAAHSLGSLVRMLEEHARPDWHADPWVCGYYAGRIYEGQRLGITLGHVLNGLALNLNKAETK